jgi:hypothetical protein
VAFAATVAGAVLIRLLRKRARTMGTATTLITWARLIPIHTVALVLMHSMRNRPVP